MGIAFQDVEYHDDRMFVLSICRGTVVVREEVIETTIHHDDSSPDSVWCLVTYRNVARYPAVRVDHFPSFEAAREYLERVEPTVPRVSLAGQSPPVPMSFDSWTRWKSRNGMKEYDFRPMHGEGATGRREVILSTRQAAE